MHIRIFIFYKFLFKQINKTLSLKVYVVLHINTILHLNTSIKIIKIL